MLRDVHSGPCQIRVVVHLLSCIWLFATPWPAACQASLSFTVFRSFVQTRVHWVDDAIQPFYPLSPASPPALNLAQCLESAVCIMWPKYWRFGFSISPSNGYSGLISFRIEWFEYCVRRLLFSWVCWIKHRLLLCDLACLHSSWHSLGDFIWTLPRIWVLEFFGNKARCKWLPGPQCASFQALVSIASYRARPPSKCRSAEPVLFLCKVSVRIANLLFWNMIGESFCGMWGLSVVVWEGGSGTED